MFFDSTPINKTLIYSAHGVVIAEAHDKTFALLVTKSYVIQLS